MPTRKRAAHLDSIIAALGSLAYYLKLNSAQGFISPTPTPRSPTFHQSLGASLARRVPGARFTLVENEGHFSIAIRQVLPVLRALRERM